MKFIPGLLFTSSIAILALLAGSSIGLLGGVANALVLGLLLRNLGIYKKSFDPGVTFSEKSILSLAIILIGINLDATALSRFEPATILLVVSAILMAMVLALIIGKAFGYSRKNRLLIGVGTAICGSSAIAATAPMITDDEGDIGISIAVVNLLGVAGIFLLPLLARAFDLSVFGEGLLVGSSLQAVGHVVAAGYSLSDATGDFAVVVKMGRVALLLPLVLLLRIASPDQGSLRGALPNYLLGFALMATISSLGLVPAEAKQFISFAGKLALAISMAAIGLNINLQKFLSQGPKMLGYAAVVSFFHVSFILLAILFIGA